MVSLGFETIVPKNETTPGKSETTLQKNETTYEKSETIVFDASSLTATPFCSQ